MSTFVVLDAFSFLRREIGRISSSEMKALDLGPKQMHLLYRLSLSTATMGELADYTLSDKASTTRAVAALESAGLVRRTSREDDRRVIVIELTAKGKQKAGKAVHLRNQIGERVEGTLTNAEKKTLAALLEKAAHGLKNHRLEIEERD